MSSAEPATAFRLLIVGAGGLGREIHIAAQEAALDGGFALGGFLDERAHALSGTQLSHVPVHGAWQDYRPSPDERLIIAIGDAASRWRVAQGLAERGARFARIALPSTRITSGLDRLGDGCFVDHYALVSCDVRIGAHCYLGSHATIGHDVTLGEACHVGAFCFIGGGATLGARVTLRSHVTVAPGSVIEDDATVGPNSVVLRRVYRGQTVLGVPAVKVSG